VANGQHTKPKHERGVGNFTLELDKNSGSIDLILGDIFENSVSFDINGPIPGHG
jgi:hypothetical protein